MNTRRFVRLCLIVSATVMAGCGGKGGSNNGTDGGGGGGGGDAGMLPDNGPCTPGALRCNGNNVEMCNGSGTEWVVQTMCTTFCADDACALPGLDVTSNQQLDGIIHVQGAVEVHDHATQSTPSGNLKIFADSITVDVGGAIAVAATGSSGSGAGVAASCSNCGLSGGNYSWGSTLDAYVFPGSPGGAAFGNTTGAAGGGVLQLLSPKIVMNGQLTADGQGGLASASGGCDGGGGASGGGILLFGDSITVNGSISAAGGPGGPDAGECLNEGTGPVGGPGRVKLLYGSLLDLGSASGSGSGSGGASIIGQLSTGLAPPLPLTSTSHPDPAHTYNDNFVSLDVDWSAPFSVQGYYVLLDTTAIDPPTAADATFQAATKVSFSATAVQDGLNYIHVVSIDQMSNIGTIESTFPVHINTEPPEMSSSSHPNQTVFSTNVNPLFTWVYPQDIGDVSGAYYVFDHFGTTVPATTDTMLPATQTQLLMSNTAPGVWVMHVVSIDLQGRTTKVAGNYRVNIGTDPGSGGVSGHVVDSTEHVGLRRDGDRQSWPVHDLDDRRQRQLLDLVAVTAGMWELSATMGAKSATQQITVTMGMTTTGDLNDPVGPGGRVAGGCLARSAITRWRSTAPRCGSTIAT